MLLQLRVLAGLQRRMECGPLPALAGWLAEQAAPVLAVGATGRGARRWSMPWPSLPVPVELLPMMALLDNQSARTADARGFQAAGEAVQRIDAELAAWPAGRRRAATRRGGSAMRRRWAWP